MNQFAMKRQFGPQPNYEYVTNFKRLVNDFFVLGGPCSVETPEQIHSIAPVIKNHGGTHLRGGLFRAGTYPGRTFGLVEKDLLEAFKSAAIQSGLKTVIEVLDYSALDKVDRYADCFQVGCRQMQNYQLLKILGRTGKPIFLKRHPGATIDEFLGAAEHILGGRRSTVILIERGSSGSARHVRWDLSISMIPAVRAITQLPILVDGSHGTGRRDLVVPMNLAGIAAGADGLLVEVHPNPERSLSDSDQAIDFSAFGVLMSKVSKIREALR